MGGLCDVIFPPKGHNPWLSGGSWWGGLLMVLVITAPAHVPYLTVLGATAWGLFQQHPWARIVAIILLPFAAILSLFAWGGTIVSMYEWLGKGNNSSHLKYSILTFSPTAILSAAYCIAAGFVWFEPQRESGI